jgi:carbamoyl-phosphate synthase large subunit
VLPPVSISENEKATILDYTRRIAAELKVVGLMNMQFAIEDGKVYVIEANPRASRTVPLVSKVAGIQMARIATRLMLGETVRGLGLDKRHVVPYYGVKEAVLPFEKFPEVDPVLGPEMRSTGEVLGLSANFGEAYYKAQEATQTSLPTSGTVLISINDRDKAELTEVARGFRACGFDLAATAGTAAAISAAGIPVRTVDKINEGRPNVLDLITNGEVDIIVNTPIGKQGKVDDSYIRKAAIKGRLPYVTTMAAARATLSGIRCVKQGSQGELKSLQQYHSEISDKE